MDIETAKQVTREITECKVVLTDAVKDIEEIKHTTVTKEMFANLLERVVKMEQNQSKLVWIVITAVLGAVLMLILK